MKDLQCLIPQLQKSKYALKGNIENYYNTPIVHQQFLLLQTRHMLMDSCDDLRFWKQIKPDNELTCDVIAIWKEE